MNICLFFLHLLILTKLIIKHSIVMYSFITTKFRLNQFLEETLTIENNKKEIDIMKLNNVYPKKIMYFCNQKCIKE